MVEETAHNRFVLGSSPSTQTKYGAVVEWLMATVLKIVLQQCNVGSNPTCSAKYRSSSVG